MKQIIKIIDNLKSSEIRDIVDSRIKEFENLGEKESNELFKELCFCFMTANFSAHRGIEIQNAIQDGFLTFSEKKLAKRLAELGHRFPNARASYVFGARSHKDNIKETLDKLENDIETREWIVKNIKGIGMKEASHFLRNIGYKNLAIIDFHIVDLLVKNDLIEKPKTLTPKKYIEIENVLNEIAQKTNLSLGELDLYLWYEETGKILK